MFKKGKNLLALALLLSLPLTGCDTLSPSSLENGETETGEQDEVVTEGKTASPTLGETELPETRTIVFAPMEGLVQGEVIDLDDYVTIQPGQDESEREKTQLYYDYDILGDGVNLPVVSTYDDGSANLSLYKSKKLVLARPGRAVLRVFSRNSSAILTFDIAPSKDLQDLLTYFQERTYSQYAVAKGFTLDSSTLEAKPASLENFLYKTDNYLYRSDSYQGYIFNKKTQLGYPFHLDGTTEEDASSFIPLPNGSYNTATTLSQYRNQYPALSIYFTSDNLQYIPMLESLFGSKFKFAFPYLDENATAFQNALTSLGLSYSRILGGRYYYTVYLVPVIDEDEDLDIYTISSTTSGNALLEGPYIVDDTPDTIAVLDDFANGDAPVLAGTTDEITGKINSTNLENFTATMTGQYYDIDSGEPIDVPNLYEGYLPNFENETKTTKDAFETHLFSEMDSSYDFDHAIVRNVQENGDASVHLYQVDEDGEEIDQGTYGLGTDTDWRYVDSLSGSSPLQMFSLSNFRNIAYFQTDDSTFVTGPMNEDGAVSPIRVLIRGLACDGFVDSSSPFYYYIDNASLTLDIGKTLTDAIHGNIVTYLPVDEDYVKYVIDFTIQDIGTTTIG